MELECNLVGTLIEPEKVSVDWRHTMNYAAAVNDLNPRYFDDTANSGIIAPPLFAVAATWPIAEKIQNQLRNMLPPEIVMTMVHSTEHLIFHNPIIPGQDLSISGQIVAMSPIPPGTLMVIRLDALTTQGKPIFTEFSGVLFRGVTCRSARGSDDLPSLPIWDDSVPPGWSSKIPISGRAPFLYDGCTDIVFPIHTSKAFALAVGLPDIILQGTATLAFAAREIINREAAGDPTALREIACRFTGMVIPGSSITVNGTGKTGNDGKDFLGFDVQNEQGQKAIRWGYAKLA